VRTLLFRLALLAGLGVTLPALSAEPPKEKTLSEKLRESRSGASVPTGVAGSRRSRASGATG